jgi:integral membrane sensor domain MASE1
MASDATVRVGRMILVGSLVGGYAASVVLGILLDHAVGQSATLWTADGFLAAVMILLPGAPRVAAAVACLGCQALIEFAAGDGAARATLFPLVDLFEAALAAWLALRFCGAGARRLSLRRLTLLILGAIVPAAMAAGVAGAGLSLILGARDWLAAWTEWAIPGALGMGIVLPALLLIVRAGQYPEFQRSPLEVAALFAGLLGLSATVFIDRQMPLTFLMFPACALIAIRLGPPGAAVAGFVVAMVAMPMVMLGFGPPGLAGLGKAARLELAEAYAASVLFASLTAAAPMADQMRLRRLVLGRDKALRAARARARLAETRAAEAQASQASAPRRKGVADFA